MPLEINCKKGTDLFISNNHIKNEKKKKILNVPTCFSPSLYTHITSSKNL